MARTVSFLVEPPLDWGAFSNVAGGKCRCPMPALSVYTGQQYLVGPLGAISKVVSVPGYPVSQMWVEVMNECRLMKGMHVPSESADETGQSCPVVRRKVVMMSGWSLLHMPPQAKMELFLLGKRRESDLLRWWNSGQMKELNIESNEASDAKNKIWFVRYFHPPVS